jgi:hypothetical protein
LIIVLSRKTIDVMFLGQARQTIGIRRQAGVSFASRILRDDDAASGLGPDTLDDSTSV